MRGRCLCGQLSWEASGPETWACYCHCDDCRRQCGAPVVAFIGVETSGFEWVGTPKRYASSPGVIRSFCGTCGSPMAFQAEHYPGEIHVYAAQLEDPKDFKPMFHVHYREHLPWLGLKDDLPKFEGSAPSD